MSSPLLVDILAYWNLNDDGSGNVSLVDSTGNGYLLTNNGGVTLGSGIIDGGAVFTSAGGTSLTNSSLSTSGAWSISWWVNVTSSSISAEYPGAFVLGDVNGTFITAVLGDTNPTSNWIYSSPEGQNYGQFYNTSENTWYNYVLTNDPTNGLNWYINASLYVENVGGGINRDFTGITLGQSNATSETDCIIDEVGLWSRALSPTEVTQLYNGGAGNTYPFAQTPTSNLYYNNAQNDGDWGNLLNWWQNSGFTTQAVALPTATNPVNLYNQVTQNTQGANQCFCSTANFWSANFGVGLTLQASGVVNMQGTSILAGTTTDGVSMHDSSQLASTSVIDGNVTMRDGSRAFGSILGNATIYYDGGNGQFPIGGTVAGSVTYLGWPAVSPQWFNDQVSGGGNDGDFSNTANWWTDNTFTTRPINAEGTQELPDASTDVFIADGVGIYANTGTANPTVNSVTANNSNIQNISITATNGFLFSGNDEGAQNATLYGSATFQDAAYNYNSVIQGTVTYKSAASLQNSWSQNSLGNLNSGASVGSTGFVVNISGSGGGGGFISRLLNLPWFIKF